MARVAVPIVAAVLAALMGTAHADTVCRPSMLGSVRCPVGPPKPRPILQANTQAIDRVRRKPEPDEPQVFVPARRTNRLGTTWVDPNRPVSLCRPDALGNLRCR